MIPLYRLKAIYDAVIQRFGVGDIVALDQEAMRVVSVNINNGNIGLSLIRTDDDGNPVPGGESAEEVVVRFDDKRLSDIKITRECLLRNRFVDESNHTLRGTDTFRYVDPKDCDHCIHVKIDDWADDTYFDDRLYHNLTSRFMHSLRDLQHTLNMIRLDLVLKF